MAAATAQAEEAIDASIDASPAPATTQSEVRAWYCIDWANSVYSSVGISGFLPLLLQSSALSAAGFPTACGNVVTEPTVIDSLYPGAGLSAVHYLPDYKQPQCDSGGALRCIDGYCPGYPSTASACRLADGVTPMTLRVGAGTEPTTYATLCIGISIIAQAFVFVSLAATADYGSQRKRMLMTSSRIGGTLTIACCFIEPSSWWLGAPLMIITNVCFGVASVMYNAYLPHLVKSMPHVTSATSDAQRFEAEMAASSELSSKGFAWGYTAGVIGILLVLPLVYLLPEIKGYEATMVLVGAWWLLFMLPPDRYLHTRPGPPLPPGQSYFSASLSQTRETGRDMVRLPVSGWYLLIWMVGSDAVFSIGTMGGLYANSEVEWGCIPKGIGILCMFLLVPVTATIGNMGYLWLYRRYRWSARAMLAASMWMTSLIGVYALLGFFTDSLGLRYGWEMITMGLWYGLHMGAYQAFSRAIFATLIPSGKESAFYSAYELTNKGSSAFGPFILSLIQQTTGDLRWGFIFVIINIALPALGLMRLDLQKGVADAERYGKKDAKGGAALPGASSNVPSAAVASAAAAADVDVESEAGSLAITAVQKRYDEGSAITESSYNSDGVVFAGQEASAADNQQLSLTGTMEGDESLHGTSSTVSAWPKR